MSSKPPRTQTAQNWSCYVFCSHWTRSKQTFFWLWERKISQKGNIPSNINSSPICWFSISKHLFPGTSVYISVAVFDGDVQNYESKARTVKWVMCRCCMVLIHYSWDGWAECKWQWQTEAQLLMCINSSRVLDLIFEGLRHLLLCCTNKNNFLG